MGAYAGLPPCGGSGLKYRDTQEKAVEPVGLPPCGGSGLKYTGQHHNFFLSHVSLHAEGVD